MTNVPLQNPVKVFFSYFPSPIDEELRIELERHLSTLREEKVITTWDQRNIEAGTDWKNKIDEHLETADVILLLISSDFLGSEYHYSTEMKRAMERHSLGEAYVIPILLRPIDYQGAPFDRLAVLPSTAGPVTTWKNQDEAFLNIAQSIRQVVQTVHKQRQDILNQSQRETSLKEYRRHFRDVLADGKISLEERVKLDEERDRKGLKIEEIKQIEEEEEKQHEFERQENLRRYQIAFQKAIEGRYRLNDRNRRKLERQKVFFNLSSQDTKGVERKIILGNIVLLVFQKLKAILPQIIEKLSKRFLFFIALGLLAFLLFALLPSLFQEVKVLYQLRYGENFSVSSSWGSQSIERDKRSPYFNCLQEWNSIRRGYKIGEIKEIVREFENKTVNLKPDQGSSYKCGNNAEIRIYLNNLKAEATAKQENLIKLAAAVPISRREDDSSEEYNATGEYDAEEVLRGVALAQKDINDSNSSNKLEILIVDDTAVVANQSVENERETAGKVAQFLVKKEEILGVIGHDSSDVTEAAGFYYKDRLVAISPTSTAIRCNQWLWGWVKFCGFDHSAVNLNSYIFRTAPTDAVAAKDLVKGVICSTKRCERVATIYDSSSIYSKSLRRSVDQELGLQGSKVFGECDLDDKAFKETASFEKAVKNCLSRLKKDDVTTLLLIPGSRISREVKIQDLIQQIKKFDPDFKLLGGDAIYNATQISAQPTDTLNHTNLPTLGMIIAVPWSRTIPPSAFQRKDSDFFNNGPNAVNWRAAMSYDATRALFEASQIAKKAKSDCKPDECRRLLWRALSSDLEASKKKFQVNSLESALEIEVQFNAQGDRVVEEKPEESPKQKHLGDLVEVVKTSNKLEFRPLP